MATWEEMVCKAKELTAAAGRKASDMADLAKMKLKMAENEKAKGDALEALGKLLYDSRHEEKDLDEDTVSVLVAQVDELVTANEELQANIDNNRGCKTCSSCGASNKEAAAYCNKCGREL